MATKKGIDQRQLGFEFGGEGGSIQPWTVPPAKQRPAEPYDAHPKGKPLKRNGEVTLLHRTGRTKRVRVCDVIGPKLQLSWPISNDVVEVSLRTGRVTYPRGMSDWKLEPNAFEMAKKRKVDKS